MYRFTIALTALSVGGLLTTAAWAEDFVIDSQETITNGGNTLDGNDTITVTDTGAVTTTGFGLYALGDSNTLTNSGTVTTSS